MDILSTLSHGADIAWEYKCREEDLAFRELENERREIDNARRAVTEKSEQLKAISGLSALIAGFAMVVQTNVNIPQSLNFALLCLMAVTTASVVTSMLVAMLTSTFLLVAIYKYDCVNRELTFEEFWMRWLFTIHIAFYLSNRCQDDWKLAFNAFSLGIPLFLLMMALVGWVVFWNHSSRNVPSACVTLIAVLTLAIWILHTRYKWANFLKKGYQ